MLCELVARNYLSVVPAANPCLYAAMGCCASKDEYAQRLKDCSRKLEGINLALRAKQVQATMAAGARG